MSKLPTKRHSSATRRVTRSSTRTVTRIAARSASLHDEPNPKRPRIGLLPLPERPTILGRAFVCGQGDLGQLGLGEFEEKLECKRPTRIEDIDRVVDICAGGMHTLILTDDGKLHSFGCNDEGALGRTCGSEFEPHAVDLPGRVLKMSAGDSHSACLLEDGRAFVWGAFRNALGCMENNKKTSENKCVPEHLLPGQLCCDIASGDDHLVLLTTNGVVYTLGCGDQGQLGRITLNAPIGDGHSNLNEQLRPGEVKLEQGKHINAIWASNHCTFMREAGVNGKIWACGLNNFFQLGSSKKRTALISTPINSTMTAVKKVAGGVHHTLVLKKDGRCMTIGRSDYGRLGLGRIQNDVKSLQTIPMLTDMKVQDISCGCAESFAITADGKLYAWGMGTSYQLGTGEENDILEPTMVRIRGVKDARFLRVCSGGQHTIFMVEDQIQNKNIATIENSVEVELTEETEVQNTRSKSSAKAKKTNQK